MKRLTMYTTVFMLAAYCTETTNHKAEGALMKYLSILGLALTAVGIIVGFYLPTTAARWSGPEAIAEEHWLQIRSGMGTALVLTGTLLQIVVAWRQRP